MKTDVVSLKDYLSIFMKYSWLILFITLSFTLAGAFLTYFVMTPVYEARGELLINETIVTDAGEEELENLDNQFKLIGTYMEILKSPRVLNGVNKDLRKNGINEDISSIVRYENVEDTQVIKIIVQHESPDQAEFIADEIAKYSIDEIEELMKVNNVQILSNAKAGLHPVTPKPFLNISFSFALGLMVSILVVLFKVSFKKTI